MITEKLVTGITGAFATCLGLCIALLISGCSTADWSYKDSRRYTRYDDVNKPIPISSRGRATIDGLSDFFLAGNNQADKKYVKKLARLYFREASIEGINYDVAFCQMCLETDYLRFTGQVNSDQNNFCGLGATDKGSKGIHFRDMQAGVRAHIQHLKAYASTKSLRQRVIDPRFHYVRRGSAPNVQDLTGKWASDPSYGIKIARKLKSLEGYINRK